MTSSLEFDQVALRVSNMQVVKWLGATIATSLILSGAGYGTTHQPATAVQLSDGQVYFVQPPELVGAVTTQMQAFAPSATYYFTVRVPETAGEPLQQLAIDQENGNSSPQRIEYDLEDSQAFIGTRRDRGEELPLGDVTFNEETRTVNVIFDPPVPPGTTLTIGLHPERNPRAGGVYLFGITAFPAGDRPYGQFLGFGRLQIDDPGDRFELF